MGGFFASADASYQGRERMGGNYRIDNLDNSVADIDPMDMSESMQEAMHRSNLDIRYLITCTRFFLSNYWFCHMCDNI